jgi:hypothetical protein
MLRFAIDGITSFSIVPVRLATLLGILTGLLAVGIGGWALVQKLRGAPVVIGWTTIMMLVALCSSAQLLMTGVLGEYIGRVYEEVKKRPLYTVAERVNLSGEEAIMPPPQSPLSAPGHPSAGKDQLTPM